MATTWVASLALFVVIIGFLFAPVLDVTLTRRIVNPMLFASLLLAITIVFSSAATYAADLLAEEMFPLLGIASSILLGVSLFLLSVACARFAMGEGRIFVDPTGSRSDKAV